MSTRDALEIRRGAIEGRFFLVGCIRSGTTLLQSLLAAHSQIASFPETMFARSLVGDGAVRWQGERPSSAPEWLRHWRGLALRRLGVVAGPSRKRLLAFLTEIQQQDLAALYPKRGASLRRQFDGWIRVLDALASKRQKAYWVEKTPCNLGYIDVIEQYLESPRFIHIVREGIDVVASIYDNALKYPDSHWAGNWGTIDKCVNQWNHAMGLTMAQASKTNHMVVSYGALVQDPAGVLGRVCDFLRVPYQEAMLVDYVSAAQQVVLKRSPWKSGVFGPIRNANNTKFYQLFTPQQQLYIRGRLRPYSDFDARSRREEFAGSAAR